MRIYLSMQIISLKNSIGQKRRRNRKKYAYAGLFVLICSFVFGHGSGTEEADSFHFRDEMLKEVQERTYGTYLPVFSFMEDEMRKGKDGAWVMRAFADFFPLYEYAALPVMSPARMENQSIIDEIIEGEENHDKEQEDLDLDTDLIEAIRRENEDSRQKEKEEGQPEQEFAEAEKVLSIDREALQDFDRLVSDFYAVDSTTYIGRDQLDVYKLSEKDMTLQQTDSSMPQILIYHTHSQESFIDSVPGDDMTTIMGAGEKLAGILRDKYGFNVIHYTGNSMWKAEIMPIPMRLRHWRRCCRNIQA